MIRILKSFFYFIIFLFIGLGYILFTSSGKQHLYDFLGHTFSQKTDLVIKVSSIDITNLPTVTAVMNVDHKAKLVVVGEVGISTLDIDYTFSSGVISFADFNIDDNLHINGHVSGTYSNMYVTGEGTILGGKVVYETTKRTDSIENLKVSMKGISSSKLSQVMKQDTLINGKADVEIHFSHMDEAHKKGYFTYAVKDNNFSGIPLSLYTKVNIEDMQHTFVIDVEAPSLSLKVNNGRYNQEKKLGKASYALDVKELSDLEALLGYKYQGAFHSTGEMIYDEKLSVTGYSNTYGGVLDYFFERDGLTIGLHDVSFASFMQMFPFEPILSASTTGNIYYNFIKKTIIVNTTLEDARFLNSKLAKNFYKKSRVKLSKEAFKTARLDAGYYNGTFTADVKLGNKDNHAYLTRTIINTKKNTIKTYFDFKLQKKVFTGSVSGAYDDPKIQLNTKEAIEYQVNQKFNSLIGKRNKKRLKKLVSAVPLGNSIKDMASDVAASIVKMFF